MAETGQEEEEEEEEEVPMRGEVSHGISAQAAVIGPGAVISGVAVTVDH